MNTNVEKNKLATNSLSEIRGLLEDGYTPKSESDLSRLIEISSFPNSIIQDLVLQSGLRAESSMVIQLVAEIALRGIKAETRRKAITHLAANDDEESKNALMRCAHDEDVTNQLIALRGLKGWRDERAIAQLVDRMMHPGVALPPDNLSREDEVRRVAIESLATPNAKQAIAPLVTQMKGDRANQEAAGKSLSIIGGTQVVDALLDEALSDGDDPVPDKVFGMESVRSISSMEIGRFAQGRLGRYRRLLLGVLSEAIHNIGSRRYVLEEVVNRIDDDLLEEICQEWELHNDDSTGTVIISVMGNAKITRVYDFWICAFQLWPPMNRADIQRVFGDACQSDSGVAISFLKKALRNDSDIHQSERLPQTYANIAQHKWLPIVEVIADLLDLDNARIQAITYLDRIWSTVSRNERSGILDALINGKHKSTEALEEISTFIVKRWNEPLSDDDPHPNLVDYLFESYQRKKALRDKIAKVVTGVVRALPSVAQLCRLIVRLARTKEPKGAVWDLLEKCMANIESGLLVSVVSEELRSIWHRGLLQQLLDAEAAETVPALVNHLSGTDELPALRGEDRIWAIEQLGHVGSVEHFSLLKADIDGESIECAETATEAIVRIDPEKGQIILRESLQSRKSGVVRKALEGLRMVQKIAPETVRALHRTTESEGDEGVKSIAIQALETVRKQHIDKQPDLNANIEQVVEWLDILGIFPASQQTGKVIEEMMMELGAREVPDLRLAIARAVPQCCLPDVGVHIAEREIESERKPHVLVAWEEALDQLKGMPDRSVFNLIERVCESKLDRKSLLGPYGLDDVFVQPQITLSGLRTGLRRAERIMDDPDALTEQLDSLAELLIDELIWSKDDDPERFDKYGNKIGWIKRVNLQAMRYADQLHNLRELVLGPHMKDASGNLRQGVGQTEAREARSAFAALFNETITHMRNRKE